MLYVMDPKRVTWNFVINNNVSELIIKYSDTSANEYNSFRNHIR